MLSAIQQCIKGQEYARIEELKNMQSSSQRKICDALIEHFKADSIGLNIMCLIYTDFADCRSDIVEILKQKPKGFYSMATLTHLQKMYNASRKPMEPLVAHIESNRYCDPTIMENFKKGSFIATAVERRK